MVGCFAKTYQFLNENDLELPKSRREEAGIKSFGLTNVLYSLSKGFFIDPLRRIVYGFQHCCELGTIPEILGTCIRLVVTCEWKTQIPFDLTTINNMIEQVRYTSTDKKSAVSKLVPAMFDTSGTRVELKARHAAQRLLYLTIISHIFFYFWAILLPALIKEKPELEGSFEVKVGP
jgi:hypothetical protein